MPGRKARAIDKPARPDSKAERVLRVKLKVAILNIEKGRLKEKDEKFWFRNMLQRNGVTRKLGKPQPSPTAPKEKQTKIPPKNPLQHLDTYDGRYAMLMVIHSSLIISDAMRKKLGLPPRFDAEGKIKPITSRSIGIRLAMDYAEKPKGARAGSLEREADKISEEGFIRRADRLVDLMRECGFVEDDPMFTDRIDVNFKPIRAAPKLIDFALDWGGDVIDDSDEGSGLV